MLTVGIDIGTSYSSISILGKDGRAEAVKISNGSCIYGDSYSMPSAIFVEDNGEISIGQIAVSSKMRNPSMFKWEFKRELGTDIPYIFGNVHLLPEDCYKEIFIHLKNCAERVTGDKIEKAFITYPANYGKRKVDLVKLAAKKAGILNVEMIDEPTAAAYSYYSNGKIKQGQKLLVYDFGGGTFDVSLIEYTENGFRQMAETLGIEKCGGKDIDKIIFDDIFEKIQNEKLEELKKNSQAYQRFISQLLDTSIVVKHNLSTLNIDKENIQIGFDTFDYQLSKNEFNKMIAPLVDETLNKVESIVRIAGISMNDIDTVLLVGGTSRIPYIQEKLEQLTGKTVCADIDPELAVCMGAALWNSKEKDSCEEEIDSEYKENSEYIEDSDNSNQSLTVIENEDSQEYILPTRNESYTRPKNNNAKLLVGTFISLIFIFGIVIITYFSNQNDLSPANSSTEVSETSANSTDYQNDTLDSSEEQSTETTFSNTEEEQTNDNTQTNDVDTSEDAQQNDNMETNTIDDSDTQIPALERNPIPISIKIKNIDLGQPSFYNGMKVYLTMYIDTVITNNNYGLENLNGTLITKYYTPSGKLMGETNSMYMPYSFPEQEEFNWGIYCNCNYFSDPYFDDDLSAFAVKDIFNFETGNCTVQFIYDGQLVEDGYFEIQR